MTVPPAVNVVTESKLRISAPVWQFRIVTRTSHEPSNLPPACPDCHAEVNIADKQITNAIPPSAFKNMFLILFLFLCWVMLSGRAVFRDFERLLSCGC